MQHMSWRDFRNKGNSALDQLPLVLTRYNKPIMTVHPYGQEYKDPSIKKPNWTEISNKCSICKKGFPKVAKIWLVYPFGHKEKALACRNCLDYVDDKVAVTWENRISSEQQSRKKNG